MRLELLVLWCFSQWFYLLYSLKRLDTSANGLYGLRILKVFKYPKVHLPLKLNPAPLVSLSFKSTVMSLIIWTIQIFKHPLFLKKKKYYCIPSMRTPNYYSNIRTPTPCRARMGVTERLLAFDSLFGATARVTERLLAYCRRLRMSTRLLQSFPLDSYYHCGARKGVTKTCTSLQPSLWSLINVVHRIRTPEMKLFDSLQYICLFMQQYRRLCTEEVA